MLNKKHEEEFKGCIKTSAALQPELWIRMFIKQKVKVIAKSFASKKPMGNMRNLDRSS